MTNKEAKKLKKGQKIWIVFYDYMLEARFLFRRGTNVAYEYRSSPSKWCQGEDVKAKNVFTLEKDAKILLAKNKIKEIKSEVVYAKIALTSSKNALTKAQKELASLLGQK